MIFTNRFIGIGMRFKVPELVLECLLRLRDIRSISIFLVGSLGSNSSLCLGCFHLRLLRFFSFWPFERLSPVSSTGLQVTTLFTTGNLNSTYKIANNSWKYVKITTNIHKKQNTHFQRIHLRIQIAWHRQFCLLLHFPQLDDCVFHQYSLAHWAHYYHRMATLLRSHWVGYRLHLQLHWTNHFGIIPLHSESNEPTNNKSLTFISILNESNKILNKPAQISPNPVR